ncbi:MAG: hypothetical protein M2R45_02477 [Verrucomicrobia subdivision 3 bacterium]|nr:hypothetical protein [Limisphaerales bacterium]MCS1413265.1 hypothetical protein [Limisphaerales bacterium]
MMKPVLWCVVGVTAFFVGLQVVAWRTQKALEADLAEKIDASREAMEASALARDEEQMKAIRSLKESVESLRGLMWGATGENKRQIESLKNILSIQEVVQSAPAQWHHAPGEALDSSGDGREALAEARNDDREGNHLSGFLTSFRTPELEFFETILTDEQRVEWAERTDKRMQDTHGQTMARIPEGLRDVINVRLSEEMKTLNEIVKYSVLQQMLNELKLQESWERQKQRNPQALQRLREQLEAE